MEQVLSFPKLGLDLTLNRIAFSIFGIDIYWYGLIMATGFALAVIYCLHRTKDYGLANDDVLDITIFSTIGAIICARAYYVIFQWEEFAGDLTRIFDIRQGGIAVYGSLIGAFLTGFIVCKIKKVRFRTMADLASMGFLIGQGIGRWGNFVNIEAFGKNTTLPWGMTSESISNYLQSNMAKLAEIGVTVNPDMPVHPCFLYESIWCIIGFFILNAIYKKRKFDGEIVLIYTAWYGFERMIVEGLRTDSLMLGKVRVSQLLAGILFVVATITVVLIRKKIKSENNPEFLKLYVYTDESRERLAKFSAKKGTKSATDNCDNKSDDNIVGLGEQPTSNGVEQVHQTKTDE